MYSTSYYCSSSDQEVTKQDLENLLQKSQDYHQSLSKRIDDVERVLKEMTDQMEMLLTMIRFSPGGDGYEQAKVHFENTVEANDNQQ